jgi:hypothetical protein
VENDAHSSFLAAAVVVVVVVSGEKTKTTTTRTREVSDWWIYFAVPLYERIVLIWNVDDP